MPFEEFKQSILDYIKTNNCPLDSVDICLLYKPMGLAFQALSQLKEEGKIAKKYIGVRTYYEYLKN